MTKFNQELEKKLMKQTKDMIPKTLKELPHYSTMKNVVAGAKLLIERLMDGSRVLVVGDYDADGMMATTILVSFMRKAGFSEEVFDYIIPSRLKDGYGLSPNIIHYAIEQGFDTIVTVDNGIAAVEAIALAKEHGLTVIVTDHHTAPKVLPIADIIINPKQPGETFPFIEISGATVAWYFVAALKDELNFPCDIRQYLDFVAITIMSDVMPLHDINLGLLSYGMDIIKSRERFVYQLTWKDEWTSKEEIDETALSFSFVPMINAIGRIDDANLGVRLFLSKDKKEIYELFKTMKEVNDARKVMSRENTYNAEDIGDIEDTHGNVIIVQGKYHEGVVGIIAGRLAEKYRKPAYVFTYSEEKKIWKGSARTSGNIHLYNITNEANEFILGWGGHKGAVGLGVKDEDFEDFKKRMMEVTSTIPEEEFINKDLKPIEISLKDIDSDTFRIIRNYGPYGNSNPKPTFRTKVKILESRPIQDGLHWETTVEGVDTKYSIKAMFFNVHHDRISRDDDNIPSLPKGEIDVSIQIANSYDQNNETYLHEIFCTFV